MGREPSLPNEAEILQRARDGDKEAFRLIVEAYQDRVFGLVISMVKQREQAEDLTQEIFVKVYFALSKFRGDSAFYTWLFRLASNHVLDDRRKKRGLEISLDQSVGDEDETLSLKDTLRAPEAETPGAAFEKDDQVQRLFNQLGDDPKLVLMLREVESRTYEEMAEILNCGVNTVKSRLNRARAALKAIYEKNKEQLDPRFTSKIVKGK